MDAAIAMIQKRTSKLVQTVKSKLVIPEIRIANTQKIQAEIAPSVHEMIRKFKEQLEREHHQNTPRHYDYDAR